MVSVTVRDGARRPRRPAARGRAARRRAADLALSDVVIACGTPEGGAAVRIEPNPAARVAGAGPLTAYFEIYHLRPDGDGLARFEYVYSVRSLRPDPGTGCRSSSRPRRRPPSRFRARSSTSAGCGASSSRVPVATLPPGRYRLEITVRDQVAEEEVTRRLDFTKTS